MSLDRRGFLVRTGLTLAGGAVGGAVVPASDAPAAVLSRQQPDLTKWESVREQFSLTREYLHFGGLLFASHPEPVRAAIEMHRRGLDENPVHYLQGQGERDAAVLRAAGGYLGASPADIALTDSTTMGLGLLYNGIDLRVGQEALTTRHDFFATHDSLRLRTARTGATVRTALLYDRPQTAAEDEIVSALMGAVGPRTRVVALTWVHSSTGVKLPIKQIAAALAEVNADRSEAERALLCVDGVHGLGVEDATVDALGCDFLVAGCHKWLFGPRGTGLVWGSGRGWAAMTATIPSFTGEGTPGAVMTPGGFHTFEHRWALAQAFEFHRRIGKQRVAARIHDLNRQMKEGLAAMPHVTVYTPMSGHLSAGLICFDVEGLAPRAVVQRLRDRKVIITTTPYTPTHARIAPGLLNSPEEVERALAEIRALA